MIPKIIHYCWFGKKQLPNLAKKCIASWKKYMPDYEIKQWNEDNFDVNIIPYTRQAYESRKYAFVSDYARFYILNKFGGIYLDTDYNKNDLYFISNMVFWGTLIYSFGIILSNNIFSPINRGNVNFINIPINANGLPQVLMPGIILILSKIFSFKKVSLFNYLALICCSIVILYSASRTGLFSLGFALLLFFIYSTKNRKIVIILLIFLSLFFLAFYEFDVFLRVFKFDFSGRIELWKEAIELSQKNIIFGNGFDYYKENTNFSFGDYGCHNAFLDVLMSNGLIGLSLILLLFIVIIYKGIKQKTVIALMSSTIISMMLESAINYPFIISITLCILINRHRNYEFTYERSKYVF